jgi:hypothetical protein
MIHEGPPSIIKELILLDELHDQNLKNEAVERVQKQLEKEESNGLKLQEYEKKLALLDNLIKGLRNVDYFASNNNDELSLEVNLFKEHYTKSLATKLSTRKQQGDENQQSDADMRNIALPYTLDSLFPTPSMIIGIIISFFLAIFFFSK